MYQTVPVETCFAYIMTTIIIRKPPVTNVRIKYVKIEEMSVKYATFFLFFVKYFIYITETIFIMIHIGKIE